jgi:hypothetical protein
VEGLAIGGRGGGRVVRTCAQRSVCSVISGRTRVRGNWTVVRGRRSVVVRCQMRLGSVDVGRGHFPNTGVPKASRSSTHQEHLTSSTTFTSDLRVNYIAKHQPSVPSIVRLNPGASSTMSEEAKKSTLQSLRNWGGKSQSLQAQLHLTTPSLTCFVLTPLPTSLNVRLLITPQKIPYRRLSSQHSSQPSMRAPSSHCQ